MRRRARIWGMVNLAQYPVRRICIGVGGTLVTAVGAQVLPDPWRPYVVAVGSAAVAGALFWPFIRISALRASLKEHVLWRFGLRRPASGTPVQNVKAPLPKPSETDQERWNRLQASRLVMRHEVIELSKALQVSAVNLEEYRRHIDDLHQGKGSGRATIDAAKMDARQRAVLQSLHHARRLFPEPPPWDPPVVNVQPVTLLRRDMEMGMTFGKQFEPTRNQHFLSVHEDQYRNLNSELTRLRGLLTTREKKLA